MKTSVPLEEKLRQWEEERSRLAAAIAAGPSKLEIGYEAFTKIVAEYDEALLRIEALRRALAREAARRS